MGDQHPGRWALTGARAEDAAQRYLAGEPLIALEVSLGISRYAIKSAFARAGVPLRDASESRRTYAADHHYFDTIDTEPKAYWLGLLAADGCVHEATRRANASLSLSLKTSDGSHVEAFRQALGAGHPVAYHPPRANYILGKRSWSTGSAVFTITSPTLTAALVRHGVTPRKSATLRWPTTVPEALYRHYLRGFIDGDGSWGLSKRMWMLRLVGPVPFLERCAQVMSPIGGPRPIYQHANQSVPHLQYAGRLQCTRLFQWLYDGATIFLPRKAEAVRAAIESFRDRRTRGLFRAARRAGAGHPGARLTEAQAADIRERYAAGDVTRAALARSYGVSWEVIARMCAGKTYRDERR